MLNGITIGILLIVGMLIGAFLLTIFINLLLVPIIKTPKKVVNEIVDLMKLKKEDVFVDLGCGDGNIVLQAYANSKCKSYGLDLSPIMIVIARTFRILRYPVNKDIVFNVENIYEAPLEEFSKVYCYLDEKSLKILKKRFEKLIKDGGEIYSYKYKIGGLREKKKIELSNKEYLYIYR